MKKLILADFPLCATNVIIASLIDCLFYNQRFYQFISSFEERTTEFHSSYSNVEKWWWVSNNIIFFKSAKYVCT